MAKRHPQRPTGILNGLEALGIRHALLALAAAQCTLQWCKRASPSSARLCCSGSGRVGMGSEITLASVPLQLRGGGGGGSKPDRIRGGGGGNRLEGPSCTILAFFLFRTQQEQIPCES